MTLLRHCRLQDAMIMGADYYESDKQRADLLSAGRNPIGIGDNCTISNTIVDKNSRIGANCTIVNKVRGSPWRRLCAEHTCM